jgi:hypothetical protein
MGTTPRVARQQLGRHVPAATNTRDNRRIVRGIVFYTVRVVSSVSVCIPQTLLDNGSVNTFPQQRIIFRGTAFYAVRVVSKESRRLVPTRISCYFGDTLYYPPYGTKSWKVYSPVPWNMVHYQVQLHYQVAYWN